MLQVLKTQFNAATIQQKRNLMLQVLKKHNLMLQLSNKNVT